MKRIWLNVPGSEDGGRAQRPGPVSGQVQPVARVGKGEEMGLPLELLYGEHLADSLISVQ